MKIDKPSQITLTLHRETRQFMEHIAKREQRSVTAQIRRLLLKAIDAEGLRAA